MSEHSYNGVGYHDTGILSLLGGGGGVFNNGRDFLQGSSIADGTAQKAQLDGIHDQINTQSDQIDRLLRDRQIADMQLQIGDVRTEIVSTSGEQRREIQASISQLAAKVAECCCETQKEVVAQGSATRELINARALDDAHRDLDRASRQSETSQILAAMQAQTNALVAALSSNHHHHPRPTMV